MHSLKPNNYNLTPARSGFSLVEVLVAMAIIAILGSVMIINLYGKRTRSVEIESSTKQIVALLREAQSNSFAGNGSARWGVHFENSTTTRPFFALFRGTYSVPTRERYTALLSLIGYDSSTVPVGGSTEIMFSQLDGFASASTTIKLYLLSDPSVSSLIRVSSSGLVTY